MCFMLKIPFMYNLPKCRLCPYRLGTVRCIKDPCPRCRKSKSRENPFDAVRAEKIVLNQ